MSDHHFEQPGAWPVYGHAWAIRQLANAVSAEASTRGPRHAYLFVGPRQIGKSTFARAFAKALLCESASARPCGVCRSCQLMNRETHADFRLVQPTRKPKDAERSDGFVADRLDGTLRAEQATDVVRDVVLRPVEGRYKVILIQDAHTANASFANKLLKTLEEPPPHVVVCLTALDRNSLLPTIVSRCQVLELRPLDAATVEHALIEHWHAQPAQASLLARLATGRLGWAVEQLHSKDGLQERQLRLEALWSLIRADRIERLAFAEELAAGRSGVQLFGMLELWASWWRDVMLTQADCSDACTNIDHMQVIVEQSRALSPERVQAFMKTLKRVDEMLHHTVNTRLALDVLLLRLPQWTPSSRG
jgi:DNA polymerase-3 subunit delta'